MNQTVFLNLSIEQLQQVIYNGIQQFFKDKKDTTNENDNLKTVWLTRVEAAEFLHISLPTLDLYTKMEKIHAIRMGRKKLYNQYDLNEALKKLKIKYK